MARIEKTVFISYRRTDVYTALAVYENLKNQGYDVFFDYRSISSGDFEQIINSNIRARAHFLLILTPTALDRCNESGDWLRREIELAIDEKRNIVPLFFKGFRFGVSSTSGISKWLPFGKPIILTGKLKDITRYNGLNVHEDYFEEAMYRLRTEFLNKPLETVLHPVSTEVQKVVKEEQTAADEALKQREESKEPIKPIEEKLDKRKELDSLKSHAIQYELKGDFWEALQIYYKIKKMDPVFPRVDVKIRELEKELRPKPVPSVVHSTEQQLKEEERAPAKTFPYRLTAVLAGGLLFIVFCTWGGISLWNNLPSATPKPTQTLEPVATNTPRPVITKTPSPTKTLISFTPMPVIMKTPSLTKTLITSTSTLGIGSTMTGADGMTLLYVPAGDFTMGSNDGVDNEKPVHKVSLDAFWIDQTEVTNAMYAKCVKDGQCDPPSNIWHFSNSRYANHPVVYVNWNKAEDYCSWTDRRLPTESEWEKAARGTNGNIYPWGNDVPKNNLLNYNSAVGDTTEVGKYPDGKSVYGALDMAGNVWEWVSSLYKPYPYDSADGRESLTSSDVRVSRGGSWSYYGSLVRSASRGWSSPSNANNTIGFRCASSP